MMAGNRMQAFFKVATQEIALELYRHFNKDKREERMDINFDESHTIKLYYQNTEEKFDEYAQEL